MEIAGTQYVGTLVGGAAPSAANASKEFEALFFSALLKASGVFESAGTEASGAIWGEFFVQHLGLLMAEQYNAGIDASTNDVTEGGTR